MGFNVFKKCVDKIPLDVEIIFGGMSEPFLNPDCTKMILYAHTAGHKISVDTTLDGMGLSDIDLLEQVPFNGYFAVHLPSGEGYEKIQVDENYIKLLNKISKSKIEVLYHYYGETVHPKVKLLNINTRRITLCTRAGNVKIKNKPLPKRQRGVIACIGDLHHNVLLPNGDVLLCVMDYGMNHLLGNLLTSGYESLFRSEEYLKVKKGLKDESFDVLCRYCDQYLYNVNLFVKLYNYWYRSFKDISSLKELYKFVRKATKDILKSSAKKGIDDRKSHRKER